MIYDLSNGSVHPHKGGLGASYPYPLSPSTTKSNTFNNIDIVPRPNVLLSNMLNAYTKLTSIILSHPYVGIG